MAEVTALRSNALPYPIYGAPWTLVAPILDADGDLVTGASGLDSEVSKNGDTFADCTNEATEIATSSGMYYLTLTGTEMTADVVAVIVKTSSSGAKTTPVVYYPRKLITIRSGTAQGGDSGYITLDGDASDQDDFYNGMVVIGTLDATTEVRVISDYTGSNKRAAVTPDWVTVPDNDDTFVIKLPEGVQINAANLTHIAGAAVSTTAAQLGVNVVQVSGDAGAADNLEAAVDGTGYNVGAGQIVAASVTGAVGSVTGNVTGSVGSVVGAVGSVSGNVAGSVNSVATTVNANVTTISGDATAADNAESFFDGTGYAGTNNVIPTVTTLTNLPAGAATAAELAKVPKSDGAVSWNSTALGAINAQCDTAISDAQLATAAALATVDNNVDSILDDTAQIGAAGAGLTAIPWNAAWDVEVQSEAADALAVYDPPTNAEMEARTLPAANYFDPAADTVANVTTVTNPVTAGTVTDKTGYALTAAYDAAKTAAAPGAAMTLTAAYDAAKNAAAPGAAMTLTSAYDAAKSAAPAGTALSNVTWTDARAAKLDNADVATSTRLATAGYTAPDNASVAAILEDTGTTLPATLATLSTLDAGDVADALTAYGAAKPGAAMTLTAAYDAAKSAAAAGAKMDLVNAPNATAVAAIQAGLSTLDAGDIPTPAEIRAEIDANSTKLDATVSSRASQTSVDTVDGVVDAVKLKTDNLPAAPAAVGSAMILTAAYDAAKTAAPASTALSNATWTDARAGRLDNLDAAISTRSTYAGGPVASVTGNVGGNVLGSVASVTGSVTVDDLDVPTANKIADHVLRRSTAAAEDSADGDTKAFRSLLGAVSKLVNKIAVVGDVLTTYETDDVTPLGTQTLTSDPDAEPITGVDTE